MKHRGPSYWCLSQNLLCSGGFPSAASGKKQQQKTGLSTQEMQEMRVGSLGQEDPLEEGMQYTPIFLPGESSWTEEPGGLQSKGAQRVGHN